MNIAIVVDNPIRDLPGLVLVAGAICRAGATCHLVPMNLWEREVRALAPDFVLLNYLRKANECAVREFLEAGIRVGVLDTEGGVLASFAHYATAMAQDAAVRGRVSCYCSWGSRLARHAVEAGWYRADQIVVTGAPRYDFYASPWQRAALAISSAVDDFSRPLVMFNGSFSWANPQFMKPDKEADLLVRSGFDRDFVLRSQQLQRGTMVGLARLANNMAARFPKVTFVYRPHPFEGMEVYEKLLLLGRNLFLVRAGPVGGWLLNASAVVQRGCSTAIEAGMVGVPAFSPSWLPVPFRLDAPESVSIQCGSEEEMFAQLEELLAGRLRLPSELSANLERVIADWFHRVDGQAHERVATAVLNSGNSAGSALRRRRCRRLAYGVQKADTPIALRIRAAIQQTLNLPPGFSLRQWKYTGSGVGWWDNSLKHFDKAAVGSILRAIETAAGAERRADWAKLRVATAEERGDYHTRQHENRSLTVFST